MKARVCGRCGALITSNCQCRSSPQRSTTRSGYDRKWQRFRKRVISLRSKQGKLFCAMCGTAFGADSPHADHIVPVENQSDPLFFDEKNIQLLHPLCHGIKTAADVQQGTTRK